VANGGNDDGAVKWRDIQTDRHASGTWQEDRASKALRFSRLVVPSHPYSPETVNRAPSTMMSIHICSDFISRSASTSRTYAKPGPAVL
jgi:hypothetical protein